MISRSATSSSAPTANRRRCSACSRKAAREVFRCAIARRRGDAGLCGAPLVREDARRSATRQARPSRADPGHGRTAAAAPPAPLRAAARLPTCRVRAPRAVPMDPYALGLLLGDGCLTTRTTPSFTTKDPELARRARRPRSTGSKSGQKTEIDYVLRRDGPRRGPLRQPGDRRCCGRRCSRARPRRPSSSRSSTSSTLRRYGSPSSKVCSTPTAGPSRKRRDPAASSTRRARHSCTTTWCSSSARSAVSPTAGYDPRLGVRRGWPAAVPCHHRSDAYILDIRLPARDRALPARAQGGRSTRRTAPDARCASSTASSPPARRRRSASRSRPRTPCTSPTTSSSPTTPSTRASSSWTRRRTRRRSR